MKNLLIIISLFFNSCETKKSDRSVKLENNDSISKVIIVAETDSLSKMDKELPVIMLSEKNSINKKFTQLLSGKTRYYSLNESRLFNSNYSTLNKLYFLSEISKGISMQSDNNIEVSVIFYKDNSFAERVFDNIKIQLTDKNNEIEKGNYFFDYFKKGTVYLLEGDKIVTIIYNPFTFPKTDKSINNFLLEDNKNFNSIIRTYSIGSYQNIK